MAESLVIFSIAVVGSLVRWSADILLKCFAIKEARAGVPSAYKAGCGGLCLEAVDPIMRVGFILACYGAIVLALVSAVPGALALERTGFAFALLCAGGLVGEISGTGVTPQASRHDEVQQDSAPPRQASRSLSMALALTLNVSIALLIAGHRLIPILTLAQPVAHAEGLEPLIVIARRSHDQLDEQ